MPLVSSRQRHRAFGLLGLLLFVTSGYGSVVYVDDDAPAGGDGATWQTAYRYLQDALSDASAPGSDVTEIRVGQGAYKPDETEANPEGTGLVTAAFQLTGDLSVRGGFAGLAGKNPDAFDPTRFSTVLSGDLLGDDGPNFSNYADNSRNIVKVVGVQGAALEGVSLVHAHSQGSGAGALACSAAKDLEVRFCTLRENYDSSPGAVVSAVSIVRFNDCTFIDNKSVNADGGAGFMSDSDVLFVSCHFLNNQASGSASQSGGALVVTDNASVSFQDCDFIANVAPGDGGALYVEAAGVTVTDCLFESNTCGGGGGGMLFSSHFSATPFPVAVQSSTFRNNSAGHSGGGVTISDLKGAHITACVFEANSVTDDESLNSAGGGLAVGDGDTTVTNCIFVGNDSAHHGGAFYGDQSSTLINCIFSGNVAAAKGGAVYYNQDGGEGVKSMRGCSFAGNIAAERGGGVFSDSGPILIDSSVFWGNAAAGSRTLQAQQIDLDFTLVPVVDFSCVQGWDGTLQGGHTIAFDPLLLDADGLDGVAGTLDDNLRLTGGSPGIDAGDPALKLLPDETDVSGEPRLVACRVDMGAHESTLIGLDCNRNGVSDGCDILSGRSGDCNANGIPDECDISTRLSTDADRNGIPDECQDCNDDGVFDPNQIRSGAAQDCNRNGIPDECDIAGGSSADCNANEVPDECDVDSGASFDCNRNGVPDECDVSATFTASSRQFSPIGAGFSQSFSMTAPPVALGDVQLSFAAVSDLGGASERVDVFMNGRAVGITFGPTGTDCPSTPDADAFTITAELFNGLAASGRIVVELIPSATVSPLQCADPFIAVTVMYPTPSELDLNQDGIPNSCQLPEDLNGDGDVDGFDLALLLGQWTGSERYQPCPPAVSADFSGDCRIDGIDLAILLAAWT